MAATAAITARLMYFYFRVSILNRKYLTGVTQMLSTHTLDNSAAKLRKFSVIKKN